DKYCNPQKLASYQHWLAPSLNQFLEKMATLEGLPPHKVHTLPNIERAAEQILILQEKFSQTIKVENQRLDSKILNTEQMNIGVMLLAEQILSQYDDFLQQYRAVYQQLQDQIQRVDVNQSATGLEIRSVEIANLRSTINRIINEQCFHQRLVASQRCAEALMEMTQEELSKSLLDRQNVEILKENLYKQAWRKF
ncbi:unnamed protein product, partial [Didymodactylos carnosus]